MAVEFLNEDGWVDNCASGDDGRRNVFEREARMAPVILSTALC